MEKIVERNYGIDLLRVLSMFMVVILHVLGCGGVLRTCSVNSINYYVSWFLEVAAFCAVDVFAMISGYVMVKSNVNTFKIIPLWLTVFFYSSIITLLFKFIPFFQNFYHVSLMELIKGVCFPVASVQYWYFTSYFCLFFFIPFVNKLLNAMTKKEYEKLIITIIAIFSLFPLIALKQNDMFYLGGGYSPCWLLCMYVIGAFFKLYPLDFSKKKLFLIYLLSITLSWGTKIIIECVIYRFVGNVVSSNIFVDHNSIFIIIASISLLLLLFSKIDIKKNRLISVIKFVSPLSFSVYLIHVQPYIYNYILDGKFSNFSSNNTIILVLKTLLVALCIFAFCIIIDIIRFLLFKFFRINKLPNFLLSKFCKKE